jgi:hypothetical protein
MAMESFVPGPDRKEKAFAAGWMRLAALSALILSLSSCSKPATTASTAPPKAESKAAAQTTFASPEDAGAAVRKAAQSGDQQALLAIFGPDGRAILFSGDAVKDKDTLQEFVAAYDQMHRWREIKAGGEMLSVGADNFLFPIPLGKNSAGQWQFDTAAGDDEIRARRIGRDELVAIDACGELARAQAQYFSQPHDGDKVKQYAQKFVSDEGQQNGLYWPVATGQPPSPLEGVRDFAKALGYTSAGAGAPQAFDGYYFRILTRQGDKAPGGARDYVVDGKMTGGFAVLAYPVDYRNSGIMTFIIGPDGVVYQKDLGENTPTAAPAVTEYNPEDGWTPAV